MNLEDLTLLEYKPNGILVVVAPVERWEEIAKTLVDPSRSPKIWHNTPVLFLQPGEKLSTLSTEELAAADLKRI